MSEVDRILKKLRKQMERISDQFIDKELWDEKSEAFIHSTFVEMYITICNFHSRTEKIIKEIEGFLYKVKGQVLILDDKKIKKDLESRVWYQKLYDAEKKVYYDYARLHYKLLACEGNYLQAFADYQDFARENPNLDFDSAKDFVKRVKEKYGD